MTKWRNIWQFLVKNYTFGIRFAMLMVSETCSFEPFDSKI